MAAVDKKLLLFCSCLFYHMLTAQAADDDFFTQNYTIQARLANGLVFDILQDKQGFMWFATEFGLIQYDGHSQKIYKHFPGDPHSLAGNVITALANTDSGDMWVGTMSNGLHYFNRHSNQFIRYQYNAAQEQSLSHNKIEKILVRKNGQVWASTDGGGVNLFVKKTQTFQRFRKPSLSSDFTNALLEDKDGSFWLGTYHGLDRWDPQAKRFVAINGIRDLDSQANVLKALVEDSFGGIWIGMRDGGLFHFDKTSKRFSRIVLSPNLIDEAKEKHIWEILPDRQGNLWIASDGGLFHLRRPTSPGTPWHVSTLQLNARRRVLSLFESADGVIWVGTNEGVFTLAPKQKRFLHFSITNPLQAGKKVGISCVAPAKNGQIWVGTIDGLFQFDPVRQTLDQDFLKNQAGLRQFAIENISSIFEDRDDNLWISTVNGFNVGFNVFYLPKKGLNNPNSALNFSPRCLPFRSHVTFKITQDATGNLWFANGSGLVRYFPKKDSLQVFQHNPAQSTSIGSNFATSVFFSKHSGLWIGTNDAGLAHFDPQKEIFQHFQSSPNDPSTMSHQRVLHLFEAKNKHLWLGTEGGLTVFDPQKKTFQTFDTRHGLPETHVNGILQDEEGFIWLSTQKGISQYDPQRGTFSNYDKQDGTWVDEFWDRTSFRDSRNQLYFGGDKGLVVFNPRNILSNSFVAPVVFTDFLLSNQKVKPDSSKKLLPSHINFVQKITLRPGQNVITFHFAALSFIRPNKNKYSIQLEGFENKWQNIGTRTAATYTNLDPGHYTFRVRAANNDGLWNKQGAKIDLVVLPPWWQTIWAIGLFTALLILLLFSGLRFQFKRKLAQAEARRLQELDAFKTRFYTNITHEFRTPLTLILGPVEHALTTKLAIDHHGLELVRKSGRRLLNLVNQMLALSKLDAGSMKIHWIQADIVIFLSYVLESFHSLAESKSIDLEFKAEPTSIVMDFDKEKMLEIVGNLLSNALKFTPEGGFVSLHVATNGSDLLLQVQDTGPGIPEDHLAHIFDRFFSEGAALNGGTGIGLAIAKELTELMGGCISAENRVDAGATFNIKLPIHHQAAFEEEIVNNLSVGSLIPHNETMVQNPEADAISAAHLPLILIIEDNPDVAHFIMSCLQKRFQFSFAANGQEGVDKALQLVPDLIISDVMMPVMDGFEALKLLKTNEKTSHIPVILLTARADKASQIEGLTYGADAYLAKPFYEEELLVHIDKLLELRRRLQAYYLKQIGISDATSQEERGSIEENVFLQKVRRLTEAHLDEVDYSIEQLSHDVGMSHSQLHRKMVALTGHSVLKFVRTIKMQHAMELLRNSDLSIAEVAYDTGFSDPGYFTKVFVAEFGITPTEYRR